jgi:hypothetical protein
MPYRVNHVHIHHRIRQKAVPITLRGAVVHGVIGDVTVKKRTGAFEDQAIEHFSNNDSCALDRRGHRGSITVRPFRNTG